MTLYVYGYSLNKEINVMVMNGNPILLFMMNEELKINTNAYVLFTSVWRLKEPFRM